jgi:1,2-dihydroxy-3-keto-5-methylthiopentene dioxygenase
MTNLTVFAVETPHGVRHRTDDAQAIAETLAPLGIRFERWHAGADLPQGADDTAVLEAYGADVERLKKLGGYRSVDVIRMMPDHTDRDALRGKFLAEHIHADDEVRFFVEGSGVFYIRGPDAIYALECMRNDLIAVPKGTRHWFDMGPAPKFTAIRLFAEPDGWVAQFTGDAIATAIPLYEGAA